MKKLSLGTSDFKSIIESDCYYVDKTLLIKDLIDFPTKATIISRPRCFGKTSNLSMLKYFFEKVSEKKGHNVGLFEGLKITKEGKKYLNHAGKYPVITLTFKDVKFSDWQSCLQKIQQCLSKEFNRHRYLLESNNNHIDKEYIQKIIDESSNTVDLSNALGALSRYLTMYHGKECIILIDEYDMPLKAGYTYGYYDEICTFIDGFLSSGFKDNSYLAWGVLTGIFYIVNDMDFSRFNNPVVCSVIDKEYSAYFGFTEDEVVELLRYYSVECSLKEIRQWYSGYRFGITSIYNPLSIAMLIRKREFDCYWVNMSSYDIIHSLMPKASVEVMKNIETILNGNSLEMRIDKGIVYNNLWHEESVLWDHLLFSGFLTTENIRLVGTKLIANLHIPNKEIETQFRIAVRRWFRQSSVSQEMIDELERSLLKGEIRSFEEIFTEYMDEVYSYFDPRGDKTEDFYHAFVLGIMVTFRDVYEVKSNRESGYGRYDVMLIPKDKKKHYGIIFEFKRKGTSETLEEALVSGMKQIKDKNYRLELETLGVKHICEIAIAFEGKKCVMEGMKE